MKNVVTSKGHFYQMLAGFATYGILLVASLTWLAHDPPHALQTPIALLPVLPILLVLHAIVRGIDTMDELEQRIQLQALAFAAAGTALVTFAYGFLENVGYPHVNPMFVLDLIAGLWIVGRLVAKRKYQGAAKS